MDGLEGYRKAYRNMVRQTDPGRANMLDLQESYRQMEADGTIARIRNEALNPKVTPSNTMSGTDRINPSVSGNMSKNQYRAMANAEGEQVANTAASISAAFKPLKNTPANPNVKVNTGLSGGTNYGVASVKNTSAASPSPYSAPAPITASGTPPTSTSATETTPKYYYYGTRGYNPLASFGTDDELSGYRDLAKSIENKYGGNVYLADIENMTAEQFELYERERSAYETLMNKLKEYDRAVAKAKSDEEYDKSYVAWREAVLDKYRQSTLKQMGLADTGLGAALSDQMNLNYENYLNNSRANREQQLYEAGQTYKQDAQAAKDSMTPGSETYKELLQYVITDPENFDLKTAQAALATGQISQTQYDKLINRYNSELDERENVGVNESESLVRAYGISDKNTSFNAKGTTANEVLTYMNVDEGKDQTAYIQRVLDVSKNWGNDMNGTFVDFNYGFGSDSNRQIYVFYNGKWYKTSLSLSDVKFRFKGKFYTQGSWYSDSKGVTGSQSGTKSFYNTFGK